MVDDQAKMKAMLDHLQSLLKEQKLDHIVDANGLVIVRLKNAFLTKQMEAAMYERFGESGMAFE